jgi:hypothetical protein
MRHNEPRRCIASYGTNREVNMRGLKYTLVTLSLLAGVTFFYAGMGIEIPEVQYWDVTSYGAPLGIGLIVVVAAGFWQDPPSSSARG